MRKKVLFSGLFLILFPVVLCFSGCGQNQEPTPAPSVPALPSLPTSPIPTSEVNPAHASADASFDLTNQVVLKLREGADVEAIARSVNAVIVRKGPLQFATFALPKDRFDAGMNQLRNTPEVLHVSPIQTLKQNPLPEKVPVNDPHLSKQWGLTKAEVDKAWDLGATGSGVTVAVVDTGVDLTHPDLKDNLLAGYNSLTGSVGPTVAQDKNGHGTHVAGIIAASSNDIGVAGIAYQAKILPVKALSNEGEGSDVTIADGIIWAADHGAHIINLSLGAPEASQIILEALQYATGKGCFVVAAAGNQESGSTLSSILFPATAPQVLAVTASDANDQIANFSLRGPSAGIAAPGVSILSTYWENGSHYAYLSGTSMAAPFVAGVAALVWGLHPDLSTQELRNLLEQSALHLGSSGRNTAFGFGRVNAYWALQFAAEPKTYLSPATLDWSGGVLQGGTAQMNILLEAQAKSFGLDPTQGTSIALAEVAEVPDLPSGISPYGEAISLEWTGKVSRALTLTFQTPFRTGASEQVCHFYRWSGQRWILIGGGSVNQDSVTARITEPGIYRLGLTGLPTEQRIAGVDRIDTATLIARRQFPHGADTVILANALNFPDALAGVPLAYKMHAPILLTPAANLPQEILAEIQRLSPKSIILLGGSVAISTAIEDQLKQGYSVTRLGGANRYETAAQIALAINSQGRAVIVNGNNFPDALTMASIAAQQGLPILLTDQGHLPAETDRVLRQLLVSQTIATGGEGVISAKVFQALPNPTRLSGENRYATAAVVYERFPPQGNLLFLATGENFPDALTGGVLAAFHRSNVVLVPPSDSAPLQATAMESWRAQHLYALGGTSAVPDAVIQQMQAIMK